MVHKETGAYIAAMQRSLCRWVTQTGTDWPALWSPGSYAIGSGRKRLTDELGISESHFGTLKSVKGFSAAPALSGPYLGSSGFSGFCLSGFSISQVEGKPIDI